jgi:hypothetical protein
MEKSKAVEHPRGNELLQTVVNHIISNPGCHDQSTWHCGTRHCVGGWAQILGGMKENADTCEIEAAKLLELPAHDANWLFASYRTIYDIYLYAKSRLAGEDYFKDGFNRDGFNRDGKQLELLVL